jgi:hypothetical protein
MFSRRLALFARLIAPDGNVLARANDFADIERHLDFPDATLSIACEGRAVRITTDRFARSVELTGDAEGDAFGWLFEDNFFDLLPGETKTVRILGRHSAGTVSAKPFFSSRTASAPFGS